MTKITSEQYNQVLEFIDKDLMTKTSLKVEEIIDIKQRCSYDQYLESISVKKKVKKYNIKSLLTDDWRKFWAVWPSTKSVPGTMYKSGAKMKGMELKMHQKWSEALDSGRITKEKMQYAAECYLKWAYSDSKRMERNELQYRNGMEPWLNQEQYLLFMDLELPQDIVQEKKVYQNSTDM